MTTARIKVATVDNYKIKFILFLFQFFLNSINKFNNNFYLS